MSSKKKVLFLSGWYPTKVNPTLGNFTEKHAEAAALYNDITVLHIASDTMPEEKFIEETSYKNGVHTHIVYFKKKTEENFFDKTIKAYKFFKYYIKSYRKIKKKNGKFDIVHLNVIFPVGIIALFYKLFFGLPYVISEHWTGYLPGNHIKQNFAIRLLSRLIANNAAALLPVSNDLKQALVNHGFKAPYHIVNNVTDTGIFNLTNRLKTDNTKKILHVSSLLDTHKNISGILNVIKRIYSTRQDFELHIIGDGYAQPHIELAQKLDLLNIVVVFHKEMSAEGIANMMKEMDFFLLFSNYENFPCVLVESMASGLPIVSSDVGGIPEHLTPDKGILVKPKDESALYLACITMLDSCRKYDKEKLHKYAIHNFSYESVGKKLSDIYTKYCR